VIKMTYNIIEFATSGRRERALTVPELKREAKQGDRRAIKELVSLAGGYDALTPAQQKKVIRLLIGDNVEL